jgi:hypothetical protein
MPSRTPVTRDEFLRAVGEFKLEAHGSVWLGNNAQHSVFMHEGEPYPPKRVLSIATGVPVKSFNAGRARPILAALGFEVTRANGTVGVLGERHLYVLECKQIRRASKSSCGVKEGRTAHAPIPAGGS